MLSTSPLLAYSAALGAARAVLPSGASHRPDGGSFQGHVSGAPGMLTASSGIGDHIATTLRQSLAWCHRQPVPSYQSVLTSLRRTFDLFGICVSLSPGPRQESAVDSAQGKCDIAAASDLSAGG